jgi:CubicO group peptidase (beta-lactamase class C family)
MVSCRMLTSCFLISAAVCASQQSASVPMNNTTESRLEKDIPALMEKAGVPGLSIAVIRDGKTVWMGSFGFEVRRQKIP